MKSTKKSSIQAKLDKHGLSGVNKPKRETKGGKKFVVLAKEGDKTKLVRFGDANMSIKKDQPKRKKSYCARSGGIKGGDGKLSANHWARKSWGCK